MGYPYQMRKTSDHEPTDQQLVGDFLEHYDAYSGPQIERTVPGVTQSDVSRWRTGQWSRLTAPKREALKAALQRETGLPEPYRKRLAGAIIRTRHLLEELQSLAGQDPAVLEERPRDEGTWADYLIELVEMGLDEWGADYGARLAITFYDVLEREGRVGTADRLRWEAFKRGRTTIPWSRLQPLDELPVGTEVLSSSTPSELEGRLERAMSEDSGRP